LSDKLKPIREISGCLARMSSAGLDSIAHHAGTSQKRRTDVK